MKFATMHLSVHAASILVAAMVLGIAVGAGAAGPATRPDVQWVRPAGRPGDQPVWGVAGGMTVGLWPRPGPRGLLRIYTPYLGQRDGVIMNFIAVEPVVGGDRGLSEIEASPVDNAAGKGMTSFDALDLAHVPESTPSPARGVLGRDGDADTLTVYFALDRFVNGARPVVGLTFRSDRTHEITLATYAAADSKPMDACVLTATMGNYARLRHLHLKDQTVDAATLFASDRRGVWDFFPWHEFATDQLKKNGDDLVVSATGDLDATTPPAGWHGWRYQGRPAVQTWTTADRPGVRARVNGRTTFWGSHTDIPGGVAFENFELMTPFMAGASYRFSIEPDDGR